MHPTLFRLSLAAILLVAPTATRMAVAQDDAKEKAESKDEKKDEKKPKNGVKKYDEVITKEAKSTAGLFLVHRVEDKVYFEIPTSALDAEMLWVMQLEQTPAGFGQAGSPLGDRVVRWEQREDRVLLREVHYEIRAGAEDPIQNAVKASSLEPIVESFAVKAYGKDKAPVIDVTPLFTSDHPDFSAKRRFDAAGVVGDRTFVEKVKAFPTNIETKVLMTYRLKNDRGVATALLHHSMVKLPEEKMQPRRFDDRVGFFTEAFEDYAIGRNHQVEEIKYVTRWRLEKKDPNAEVSEPKKPIVFYIGREVPTRWRSWVKKGVEAWQPAFEAAGFKNAILAKEPPSPLEDPDWDAEDARYSSIRWLPATIENAFGPHVHDPRTGEILEADVRMYHNVLKLARDWYFVQASPNDERAQKLPLSDDLIGELVQYVVSHEVGHTLGFPHNMKASSSYTVEELRNAEFTKKNGTEASIMDYGRFNYVAQPGDGARLIPLVGPYDFFAVDWGYRQFKDAKSYEQEKPKLDEIVKRQLKDAKLRFGWGNPGQDPSEQTEDLGSDPIQATEFGLKNIDRVASYLVKATSKKGENYELLQNMYTQLVRQRGRELMHVANVVGGVVRNNVWYGDGDRGFDPIPAAQQKKAVAFLNENAFKTPVKLLDPDILQRLEPNGAADRILGEQTGLLRSLLNDRRLKRMAEVALRDKEADYPPSDLIADLHGGIWGELKADKVAIDLYRRNLQRGYVELLIPHVSDSSTGSDLPALARGELRRIVGEIDDLKEKEVDALSRLHLDDLKARIIQALDPRAPRPNARVAASPFED